MQESIMKKHNEATEIFRNGYNCSQAVLSAFGPELGLDKNSCLKLAASFGGGIARQQATCGAVIGALMALGLKYGRGEEDPPEVKDHCYEVAQKFLKRFETEKNSLQCRDLLDCDMNTDEGKEHIEKNNLYENICVNLVEDAIDYVNEILEEF